jgi:GT2 family glycosyltransferase
VPSHAGSPEITAVVVLHDSAGVIEDCLASLDVAAPRRGVRTIVVDNASRDDGPRRAADRIGESSIVRLPENRGFAAGVNAGLALAQTPMLAVVNPDLRFEPGALDLLADALEAHPRAAIVGPRVRDSAGQVEPTAGVFTTPARERVHAWMLDRLLGLPGRRSPQPDRDTRVDWISGCAWLVRGEAWKRCGPLDEAYFMYSEDVDFCRRLFDAGWETRIVTGARALHDRGTGSVRSSELPADGGLALYRYLVKFHPGYSRSSLRATLASGWWLRRGLHTARALFGHARSAMLARRYARALASLRDAA